MSRNKILIIIWAGGKKQAREFAIRNNLREDEYRYLTDYEGLFGLENMVLLKVGNWFEKDFDSEKIDEICQTRNIKIIEVR